MKVEPCPWCGEEPTTLGVCGITTTACLDCTVKQGAHGIPAKNYSRSVKAWNQFVKETKLIEASK